MTTQDDLDYLQGIQKFIYGHIEWSEDATKVLCRFQVRIESINGDYFVFEGNYNMLKNEMKSLVLIYNKLFPLTRIDKANHNNPKQVNRLRFTTWHKHKWDIIWGDAVAFDVSHEFTNAMTPKQFIFQFMRENNIVTIFSKTYIFYIHLIILMKTKEVLKILRISRSTLYRYLESGTLKAMKMPNGYYDFDETSVYSLLNKDIPKKNYIYARVSTYKQKNDLVNQIELLKNFCFQSGYKIEGIYSDIASGINFEKRKDFFQLLDEILDFKVQNVIITYKDRLSRIGFNLFYYLFHKFGTKIVVISELGNEKLDSEEIFEEIVSLLHCYSMKLYSKRKKKLIEELILQNETN